MSGATDAYHEWLLSDAPAAFQERIRRRAAHADRVAQERDEVSGWCQRVIANPTTAERLRAIARQCQREVDRAVAREVAEEAVLDDVYVRWERERYERVRRTGDPDYRYPARYLGTAAADQPVPELPAALEWFEARTHEQGHDAHDTGLGR